MRVVPPSSALGGGLKPFNSAIRRRRKALVPPSSALGGGLKHPGQLEAGHGEVGSPELSARGRIETRRHAYDRRRGRVPPSSALGGGLKHGSVATERTGRRADRSPELSA